jgi:cytochrome c-type biogenesis protein CcmI
MFIIAAALIVAGVALFVAAPLGIGMVGTRAKSSSELQAERHEHERALAVQGLRELEFDREMGKLSGADYDSMHKALEDRALTAMAAAESIRAQTASAANPKKPPLAPVAQPPRRPPSPRRTDTVPTLVLHNEPARQPQMQQQSAQLQTPSRKFNFCPQCGTRAATDSKFCAQCGIAIRPRSGATAWSE